MFMFSCNRARVLATPHTGAVSKASAQCMGKGKGVGKQPTTPVEAFRGYQTGFKAGRIVGYARGYAEGRKDALREIRIDGEWLRNRGLF